MSVDIQLDMAALSPVLHLDLPFMYRPPAQHHPEMPAPSDTTSPNMAPVSSADLGSVVSSVALTSLVQYDLPLLSDFRTVSSGIYPSPISSPATTSPQIVVKQENEPAVPPSATKPTPAHMPAPKRKRGNRYKNAPPSVLSVRTSYPGHSWAACLTPSRGGERRTAPRRGPIGRERTSGYGTWRGSSRTTSRSMKRSAGLMLRSTWRFSDFAVRTLIRTPIRPRG